MDAIPVQVRYVNVYKYMIMALSVRFFFSDMFCFAVPFYINIRIEDFATKTDIYLQENSLDQRNVVERCEDHDDKETGCGFEWASSESEREEE